MQKIDLVQSHDVIGMYEKLDFNQERRKYTDPGTVYAFDVLDGKITTGYLIKLAAFRHLRDLQRQGQADFPYTYDIHESEKLLKFASICPNVDTGEPTKLMDWQKFIFSMLFGWRNREGGKRFTRAIVSVARGQGKTYLMAILMCYSYLIESLGLSNQDYLVASINFKQTNKLYGYIKSMLRQIEVTEPFKSLADETELSTQSDQTIEKRTNNVLRAISFESGQFDSFHFTTAIVDEIGEVKSRDKVSKIISGQVKIKNKQFIQISTSYPDPSVPFHEDQKMLQQAMEQDWNRDADSYLGLIWAQDDLDETFKDEIWVKSNPLLQLPDQHDVLLAGLRDKRDSDMLSGVISDFQNKNLNLWLQESTDSFLKLNDIESAIIDNFSYDGQVAYLGFDYSMSSDNTALAFVIPYADTTGRKWHVMQHSFIPWQRAGSIEAKEKQDGINYRDLAKKGYCTITAHEQGLISTEQVFNWLVDFVDEHKLKVVFFGYDAMGVNEFIKRLEYNTSYPLQAIRQRTGELKDPTKFLQKIFVEGSVTRFDDKIMEKALINAQLYEDKVGIQVDKAKATLKIDVVDAIIDAMYQAMYHFEDFGIVNDKSNEVDLLTEQDVLDWFNSNDSDYTD